MYFKFSVGTIQLGTIGTSPPSDTNAKANSITPKVKILVLPSEHVYKLFYYWYSLRLLFTFLCQVTLIHVTLCPHYLAWFVLHTQSLTYPFLIKVHHLIGCPNSSKWDWENNQFTLETMSQPCKGNNSNRVWIEILWSPRRHHTPERIFTWPLL